MGNCHSLPDVLGTTWVVSPFSRCFGYCGLFIMLYIPLLVDNTTLFWISQTCPFQDISSPGLQDQGKTLCSSKGKGYKFLIIHGNLNKYFWIAIMRLMSNQDFHCCPGYSIEKLHVCSRDGSQGILFLWYIMWCMCISDQLFGSSHKLCPPLSWPIVQGGHY